MVKAFGWVLALLFLFSGCAHLHTDIIQVRPIWGNGVEPIDPANPSAEIATILAETSELLGYTLIPVDKAYRAVTIDFVTTGPGETAGRLILRHKCVRSVRSRPNAAILAHELGHAFGLKHSYEEGNLMNPILKKNSRELTDRQMHKIRTHWLKLKLCR